MIEAPTYAVMGGEAAGGGRGPDLRCDGVEAAGGGRGCASAWWGGGWVQAGRMAHARCGQRAGLESDQGVKWPGLRDG